MHAATRLLAVLALAALPIAAQAPTAALMPVPRDVALSGARLRLDSTTRVAIVGYRDGRLGRGVDRAVRRLEARLAIPLPRDYPTTADARIVVAVKGQGFPVPDLHEDESYRITVTDRVATIEANTVVGALRGLETLLQLQSADSAGFYLQGVAISDAPRFPWRGLLVDVSRHWEPPAVVKRILDGMAMVKLNVLHWHLSEDQGFRVESLRYPTLHEQGSDGNYYTQAEIRDIVAYATDRGIRVVPEFDMPGHTTSWFVGHPELASAPGPYTIERRWGVFRPTMDPTKESTWPLLEGFIAEMVGLFPDKYWHVGGDEVDPTQWNTSARIQAWMKERNLADTHALQTWFNGRLFEILARHQRTPVGWDEILQPGLPSGAVIQSWRGMDGLTGATDQGRQALLSAPYYLDHMKTAAEMYLADVIPDGFSAEQSRLVLGGEACMWAEYVTMETIESRIWPRMGALAERFWSPRDVRDVPEMYRRLEVLSRQLNELGIPTLTHTERMLARIAPSEDIATLVEFLRYVRPRGFGGRGTNQLSPLTRLIDAANPDPFINWEMLELAENPVGFDRLARHFVLMQGFAERLGELRGRAPIAADGIPVAAALSALGRVGTEAIAAKRRGVRPSAAWFATADSVIARTDGKTFGLLRPVGVAAVKRLLDNVKSLPRPLAEPVRQGEK